MSDFGTAFRTLRLRLGLSQSAFAEAIQCDHSYVCRVESGARIPTREFVELAAAELRLTPDETNALLIAGGWLPDDLASMLDDAALVTLHRALRHPDLPEDLVAGLRNQVQGIAMLAAVAVGAANVRRKGAA